MILGSKTSIIQIESHFCFPCRKYTIIQIYSSILGNVNHRQELQVIQLIYFLFTIVLRHLFLPLQLLRNAHIHFGWISQGELLEASVGYIGLISLSFLQQISKHKSNIILYFINSCQFIYFILSKRPHFQIIY